MRSLFYFLVLGSACFLAVSAKTKCQEHRERELASNTKIKLIPKCDENGDYEAFQCFEGSPFCMCWRKDGTHIIEPSLKLKTCACHVHRDREAQRTKEGLIGNFIPRCKDDGTYSPKQCHSSSGYCWCADENGNKISVPTREKIDC